MRGCFCRDDGRRLSERTIPRFAMIADDRPFECCSASAGTRHVRFMEEKKRVFRSRVPTSPEKDLKVVCYIRKTVVNIS